MVVLVTSYQIINESSRAYVSDLVKGLDVGMWVEIRKPKRTNEQNAKMWALLSEVAEQVEWYGQKLTPDDWKVILTASLRKQRAVPGVDGGFVVLGDRTSKMSKEELSELIELIYAFGAERGVNFGE